MRRHEYPVPYYEYHGADPSAYYGIPYRTVSYGTKINYKGLCSAKEITMIETWDLVLHHHFLSISLSFSNKICIK